MNQEDGPRDLAALVVAKQGALEALEDLFRALPAADGLVSGSSRSPPLRAACHLGQPATTQRSYGLALLRWFRFLWAIDMAWDQATQGGGPGLLSLDPNRRQTRPDGGKPIFSSPELGHRQGTTWAPIRTIYPRP